MRGPRLFRRSLLYLTIIWSVAGLALDAPAVEPQKIVLALYGSRPDLPANVIVDEIIRSTLEGELGSSLDYYAEFLDSARWPEEEAQSVMHDLLRRRYANKRISVIIAVARPAINFMRRYGDELFPGVPIVAFGDADALRDWNPARPIVGALGRLDLRGTAELALRLQPRTRELLLISGVSPSDQFLQSLARQQLVGLENRMKITYLSDTTVENLEKIVAGVQDGTVIQFLSMVQDSAGNKFLSEDALSRIAKKARVPIYSHGGIYLGRGIIGGVVFNPEELGRETAQLALRILQGERIQGVSQESKSAVPMVDWRQLRRWRISEKRLPAGTVVRYREPTIWESYKGYVVSGISLILLEALLIGALMWQRTKRRKAEAELVHAYEVALESEQRFRLVANSAPVMIWMSGTDQLCTYVNQQWLDFTGRNSVAELGSGWRKSIHPDDLQKSLDTYTKAFERHERFKMEYRAEQYDGQYRWIMDTGIPRINPDGSFAGYIGSAVDVTERKLAEEALTGIGGRLLAAQEVERRRIARELHDDVNQQLAFLQVSLDMFRQDPPLSADEIRMRVDKFLSQASEVSQCVQALSHQLHSSKLEYLGLVAAMGGFCREFSEQHHVEISFSHERVPQAIPNEVSLCLFRVTQTALVNALKHSGAKSFDVGLRGSDDRIHLTVHDGGVGFDVAEIFNSRGIGIISIRERVRFVNGTLSINSRPGGGTTIEVDVPLPAKVHDAFDSTMSSQSA